MVTIKELKKSEIFKTWTRGMDVISVFEGSTGRVFVIAKTQKSAELPVYDLQRYFGLGEKIEVSLDYRGTKLEELVRCLEKYGI